MPQLPPISFEFFPPQTETGVQKLKQTIDTLCSLNAEFFSVTFGAGGSTKEKTLQTVLETKSLGLKATFHRAFDFVPDFRIAIKKIVAFGFDRLLTSGLESKAEDGLDVIIELQRDYGHLIQIIAGSGVSAANALVFANSGIDYLHFTARKTDGIDSKLGMGSTMLTDEQKIKSVLNLRFEN